MRTHKYIKVTPIPNGRKPSVEYKVRLAWWGVPIIIYKAMKEFEFGNLFSFVLAWFWIYPKEVLRVWFYD